MRVMFDINVVLDIVGSRKPFYADSRSAFLRVIESGDEPCLAIHAYPTIYYLLGAAATRAKRKKAMGWSNFTRRSERMRMRKESGF